MQQPKRHFLLPIDGAAYVGGPPGTVTGTPFHWVVQAPANGARSIYTGLELTWQHILDNGFGAHVQYTATKSRGYDQNGNFAGAINAVPSSTVSVSLLYDKGPLAADMSWDHASSYTYACSQCTEIPGWPAIADAFDWLTASALPVLQRLRGLRRGQEPDQLDCPDLPQWQSAAAVVAGLAYRF